jgi:hypothetical protein
MNSLNLFWRDLLDTNKNTNISKSTTDDKTEEPTDHRPAKPVTGPAPRSEIITLILVDEIAAFLCH